MKAEYVSVRNRLEAARSELTEWPLSRPRMRGGRKRAKLQDALAKEYIAASDALGRNDTAAGVRHAARAVDAVEEAGDVYQAGGTLIYSNDFERRNHRTALGLMDALTDLTGQPRLGRTRSDRDALNTHHKYIGRLVDPTADGPVTDMQRKIIKHRLTEEGLSHDPRRLDGLTKGEAMGLVKILTNKWWKDGDAKGAVEAFYREHPHAGRRSAGKLDGLPVNFLAPSGRRMPLKDSLYQGHKGPGIGHLKTDRPDRRDGDGDTVVAERRPRKGERYEKSPLRMAAALARRLRGKRPKPSRRGQQPVTGLKSAPGRVPGVRVVSR